MKILAGLLIAVLIAGAAAAQDSVYVNARGVLTCSLDCPRVVFLTEVYPLVNEIVGVNQNGFHTGDTVRFDGWFFPNQMHPPCVSSNLAATHTLTSSACCIGDRGNVDCDPNDGIDIGDLSTLLDYLFVNRLPLCCEPEADMVPDANVDIDDVATLIRSLFITFESIPPCEPAKAGAR